MLEWGVSLLPGQSGSINAPAIQAVVNLGQDMLRRWHSAVFLNTPPARIMRRYFSNIYYDKIAKNLKVNLTKYEVSP